MERINIPQLDLEAGKKCAAHIDTLTKPIGSLGRLEELAVALAQMTGDLFPVVSPPGVLIFAADHGITAEGVSAYPKEVTAQMVLNFLQQGAAINVFSNQIGAHLDIIDIGVASDITHPNLIQEKISYGTANFMHEDAMTRSEAMRAIDAGINQVERLKVQGIKLLITGEMGIGNTTASSAILAVLTGMDAGSLVGTGTGIEGDQLQLKKQVIRQALKARKPNPSDPIDVLSKIGGLEIAGMAGAIIAAAANRIPILLDGFICTVAAMLAERLKPGCQQYMIAGHQSVEPGHKIALERLGKKPLLDLGMRLGEGSGAAISFPIVESAAHMVKEMATFETAGVANKS